MYLSRYYSFVMACFMALSIAILVAAETQVLRIYIEHAFPDIFADQWSGVPFLFALPLSIGPALIVYTTVPEQNILCNRYVRVLGVALIFVCPAITGCLIHLVRFKTSFIPPPEDSNLLFSAWLGLSVMQLLNFFSILCLLSRAREHVLVFLFTHRS